MAEVKEKEEVPGNPVLKYQENTNWAEKKKDKKYFFWDKNWRIFRGTETNLIHRVKTI